MKLLAALCLTALLGCGTYGPPVRAEKAASDPAASAAPQPAADPGGSPPVESEEIRDEEFQE